MAETVVLTGATSGIGRASAMLLAGQARQLILHGPEPRSDALLAAVQRSGHARVDYVQADYSRLDSVARLAQEIAALAPHVDVLVNNAGRPGRPRREVTDDGHEATLQVNYLAPVLLTGCLLGRGGVRRVVNVASATHFGAELDPADLELEHTYAGPSAYARSKLALVTYSCWLARQQSEVEVVSMHPGVIATELLHTMFTVTGVAPEVAARNVVDVVGRRGDSGTYYDERRPAPPDGVALDHRIQDWLHDRTAAMLAPLLPG